MRPLNLVTALAVMLLVVSTVVAVHAEIVLRPDAPVDSSPVGDVSPDDSTTLPSGNPEAAPRLRRQLAQMTVNANNGEVDALLRLGWVYYNGQGVNRSYSESYRRFNAAAAQGNPKAMLAAGFLLSKGLGVGRDPDAARGYFNHAAEAGYPRGWYLQSLLEDDIGTPQARLEARQLVERAASAGDPLAASALASLYERGGQPATAQLWYRQAQTLGSETARRDLARMSEMRRELRNNAEALQKLRNDSAAGKAAATYELAGRSHRGDGVPVNYGEALRLYRLATRQGSADAQRMLALIVSRSTAAEPLNAGWMLELSRLSLPDVTGDTADSGARGRDVDDPLADLLKLTPRSGATVINGSPAIQPYAGESSVAYGIGVAAPPPPAQSARPAPPAQSGNVQRAREWRDPRPGSR